MRSGSEGLSNDHAGFGPLPKVGLSVVDDQSDGPMATGKNSRCHVWHFSDTPGRSDDVERTLREGLSTSEFDPIRTLAVGRGTIKWPSYPRAMFAFPFPAGSR